MDISLFFNAKLPGRDGLYCVETRQGYLSLILPMDEVNMLVRPRNATDLNGDWLSLGGIDSQINGALGLAFGELTPDHFQTLDKISQYLWEQGVDAYLPTLVTADIDKMRQSLETLSKFMNERCLDNRAYILGVHIEGSFCNSEKGGTQPTECLKPLTLESLQVLFGEYIKLIRVITLAPELDSTGEVIPWLCEHGILANLGHSLATAVQTKAAFGQGAMMVTPALNTMSSLQYGEMGLLGATILEPKISCGLIADGQHISPQIMDLLLRARRGRRGNAQHRCENVFLVSDALAQLG
ncbi:MAG: N-acetylglucosamine-6-phosphate deacetylase, partial [Cyanobacteria bacterium P01_D01_bin.44]